MTTSAVDLQGFKENDQFLRFWPLFIFAYITFCVDKMDKFNLYISIKYLSMYLFTNYQRKERENIEEREREREGEGQ